MSNCVVCGSLQQVVTPIDRFFKTQRFKKEMKNKLNIIYIVLIATPHQW